MSTLDLDADLFIRGGVEVALDGAVLTLTLNRPEVRNAMLPSTWAAMASVGRALEGPAGADVRVVVVRGANGLLSAGLDRRLMSAEGVPGEPPVTDLFSVGEEEFDATIATYQDAFLWLRDPRWISIAVVQGYAIGGGFQLALACDLRLLAEDTLFSMREPALGIVPDLGGTKPLVECVGYSRALEITATTRYVDAAEADRLGLATRVVPVADLDEALAELVGALTTHLHGAVRDTKRVLLGASERTLDEQRAWERRVQRDRFAELAALLG